MVELKLNTKKQDIRVIEDVYDQDSCRKLATDSKDKAFSIVHNVKYIIGGSKGKIEVVHSEKRYEPFWKISAESYMEYKRQTSYGFEVKPEVRSVSINGKAIPVDGAEPVCRFPAEDHCVEQYTKDLISDAVEAKKKGLDKYLEHPTRKIKQTEDLMGRNKVVIPAQVKASFLVRELFKELIKPIHADKVIEEMIEIKELSLFFRPIYAFELLNTSTDQTGVLEVDAITGEVRRGTVFKRELKELISEDVLFEIGAELASCVIPGAGVGAVIGREYKKKRDKRKDMKIMENSKRAHEAKQKLKKKGSKKRIKLK